MKKYISTGQHPLDSFRIWFIGSIILFVSIIVFKVEMNINLFFAAFLMPLLLITIMTLLRIVRVTKKRQTIKLSSLLATREIEAPYSVETWWIYDFHGQEYQNDGIGAEGKSEANYLKLYANIKGKNNSILLCETIKMEGKFPNEHPYRYDVNSEDLKEAFNIWDVDNCLKRLQLNKMPTRSHLVALKKG